MNPVYIRVLLYFVAPLLGMAPGITHDPVAGTLLIHIETAAMGLAAAGVATAAVFARWGKK